VLHDVSLDAPRPPDDEALVGAPDGGVAAR